MISYRELERAQLWRSRANSSASAEQASAELIGEGPLWRMVRAALSDPDQELWRYSISIGRDLVSGTAFREMINSHFPIFQNS